jgi:hypothetical protein
MLVVTAIVMGSEVVSEKFLIALGPADGGGCEKSGKDMINDATGRGINLRSENA